MRGAGGYGVPSKQRPRWAASWARGGTKSTRDPDQIVAWWAGTDYDIALHAGRSGAVVFDIDDPTKMPQILSDWLLEDPAPRQ